MQLIIIFLIIIFLINILKKIYIIYSKKKIIFPKNLCCRSNNIYLFLIVIYNKLTAYMHNNKHVDA